RNELEQSETLCETALRVSDGKRQDAKMILAEVMFLRTDHAKAIQCYRDVLAARPNNYNALKKLIDLLRRAGQLDEVPVFLENAKVGDPRSCAHAGLRFCRGLYRRYINDTHEAIRHLNHARRDGEWGRQALEHLIEIYLSPNGDQLWEVASAPPSNDVTEPLEVGRKLLLELKAMSAGDHDVGETMLRGNKLSMRLRYLEHTVNMMSRGKQDVDEAMAGYISMLEEDKDHVPALLGMSVAFTLEDSPNKARNALKRIAKMPFTMEMAEEFEQAYLHLAHLYVARGKFDLAQVRESVTSRR
ncbi:unnamed protein product, partial [Sphacelaria rigidula]